MSLITNIIHDEFALVITNKAVEEQADGFEKAHLNKKANIMMSLAGKPLPQVYLDAFKACANEREAIAIVQEYMNEEFRTSTLIKNYNTDEMQDLQQMCLLYFDEAKQKFCSYSASCSNQHRNTDIKGSSANQVMYRCIGTESDQLTSLFQLKGVRRVLQNFTAQRKGVNHIMEIIDMTQRMYDVVDLIDHEIQFQYRSKYWAMDKESKIFQRVNYHQRYFAPHYENDEDDTQNVA